MFLGKGSRRPEQSRLRMRDEFNGDRSHQLFKPALGPETLVKGRAQQNVFDAQAKTACNRIISLLKQGTESPTYEVHVSKPYSHESERHYRGGEGSDACRVYKGYADALEKFVPMSVEERTFN